MAEKISPDVLLQTATQLYFSVRRKKVDLVKECGSIEDRRTKEESIAKRMIKYLLFARSHEIWQREIL